MTREKLHSKVDLFRTGGEIAYRKDASVAKFLLGGLGTGNISVGPRGELRDWEIFNWPGKGQFVPFSFFAIWVKEEGKENNLLELIAADPAFNMTMEELLACMEPSRYVGRSEVQVEAFLKQVVEPILKENQELLGIKADIKV